VKSNKQLWTTDKGWSFALDASMQLLRCRMQRNVMQILGGPFLVSNNYGICG